MFNVGLAVWVDPLCRARSSLDESSNKNQLTSFTGNAADLKG
jgi:hypothetical protein